MTLIAATWKGSLLRRLMSHLAPHRPARPGTTAGGGEGMRLRPFDLTCFGCYMILLIGVGDYFARRQKGLKSYLLADKSIPWIIVAISVLAALFSGITYLGASAESYYNDLSYLPMIGSFSSPR
jgi:hypothetical protein